MKQRLIHNFTGWLRRTTGRRYPYLEDELDKLSETALLNLGQMTRDIDEQVRAETSRARMGPWKR